MIVAHRFSNIYILDLLVLLYELYRLNHVLTYGASHADSVFRPWPEYGVQVMQIGSIDRQLRMLELSDHQKTRLQFDVSTSCPIP
jgi:hypothetical protein